MTGPMQSVPGPLARRGLQALCTISATFTLATLPVAQSATLSGARPPDTDSDANLRCRFGRRNSATAARRSTQARGGDHLRRASPRAPAFCFALDEPQLVKQENKKSGLGCIILGKKHPEKSNVSIF